MTRGIVVAANSEQEWLLPWWWERYSAHNSLPVCFFDLGMNPAMNQWCAARGQVLSHPTLAARHVWFEKPLICQKSPFAESLWIDLDCEILGPLDAAFDWIDSPAQFAAVHEAFPPPGTPYPYYNSGVLAFHRNSPILAEWALVSDKLAHLYAGDQDVLAAVLHKKSLWMTPLPAIFNWSRRLAPHSSAKIIHWHGPEGKNWIRCKV